MIYTSLLPVLTSAVGSDTPSSPALAGDIGPLAAEKKLEVQGESEGAEGRLVVLPGHGSSKSILDPDNPYPYLMTDFDSADCIDDMCDGWLSVTIMWGDNKS